MERNTFGVKIMQFTHNRGGQGPSKMLAYSNGPRPPKGAEGTGNQITSVRVDRYSPLVMNDNDQKCWCLVFLAPSRKNKRKKQS